MDYNTRNEDSNIENFTHTTPEIVEATTNYDINKYYKGLNKNFLNPYRFSIVTAFSDE